MAGWESDYCVAIAINFGTAWFTFGWRCCRNSDISMSNALKLFWIYGWPHLAELLSDRVQNIAFARTNHFSVKTFLIFLAYSLLWSHSALIIHSFLNMEDLSVNHKPLSVLPSWLSFPQAVFWHDPTGCFSQKWLERCCKGFAVFYTHNGNLISYHHFLCTCSDSLQK